MTIFTSRRRFLGWSLAGAVAVAVPVANAAPSLKMDFVTHAAFFSGEMKLPKVLDPHVFVRDSAAPEAVGPQGIKHVAGVRPPFIGQDLAMSMLFTADHKPLGFDLKTWLGATGKVTISEEVGRFRLDASFAGLKPGGTYSLFENHFDQKPVGFTPSDGFGQSNTFVAKADGTATISLVPPHIPTHDNAVLLVYHSDNQDHGTERGRIGIDAHHQLIARTT